MRRKHNLADVFFIKKHPHMNASQVSEAIDLNLNVVKELQDEHVEYSAGFAKTDGTVVLTQAAVAIAESSKGKTKKELPEGLIQRKPKPRS